MFDFDLSNPNLQRDFEAARQNIPTGFTPQLFEESYGEARDRYLFLPHQWISASYT